MSRIFVIVIAVVASARIAHAYPQFELVKDQTCTSCHLSPAGGGLLSENGMTTAETISQWGTSPELFYNKLPLPSWLELGGDVRGASGYDVANGANRSFVLFPMQAEVYAAATYQAFSLHVTAGLRDPQYENNSVGFVPSTLFASREHWLQWQPDPGQTTGLFVRVGRFMPVYSLRFAEHPYYDRRYGGTPLYGETYAAAVEYIDPQWEVHATGFIKDPIFPDSVERGNGGTLYAEARVSESTALGVESKLDVTDDDSRLFAGLTVKQLIRKDLVIEAEAELVHQTVHPGADKLNQIVGTAVASYFRGPFMVDLGVNVYHEDLRFELLDQEAFDLNLHWFMTSHVELLLTNRFQALAFGADGQSSGYSLLQIHYRL
jgi:hypothetical protein